MISAWTVEPSAAATVDEVEVPCREVGPTSSQQSAVSGIDDCIEGIDTANCQLPTGSENRQISGCLPGAPPSVSTPQSRPATGEDKRGAVSTTTMY